MHSRVSHKYYKQRRLNSFNQMQNIDGKNFDDESKIHQIRQIFLHQTFAPYDTYPTMKP